MRTTSKEFAGEKFEGFTWLATAPPTSSTRTDNKSNIFALRLTKASKDSHEVSDDRRNKPRHYSDDDDIKRFVPAYRVYPEDAAEGYTKTDYVSSYLQN